MFFLECVFLILCSTVGPPASICSHPFEEQIEIENGTPLTLSVQVKDKAGNLTVQPKLNVVCKVTFIYNVLLFYNHVKSGFYACGVHACYDICAQKSCMLNRISIDNIL